MVMVQLLPCRAHGKAWPAVLSASNRCRWRKGWSSKIYTRAFIRLAGLSGRKVRTVAQLDAALAALGSRPAALGRDPNDHESDVLIAAAGLRAIAGEARYWNPHRPDPGACSQRGLDVWRRLERADWRAGRMIPRQVHVGRQRLSRGSHPSVHVHPAHERVEPAGTGGFLRVHAESVPALFVEMKLDRAVCRPPAVDQPETAPSRTADRPRRGRRTSAAPRRARSPARAARRCSR